MKDLHLMVFQIIAVIIKFRFIVIVLLIFHFPIIEREKTLYLYMKYIPLNFLQIYTIILLFNNYKILIKIILNCILYY